ncbi:MAG: BON domain-containing protein [Betaproteobacteria bacterium]|nr:BON domain-containing protein [Betaproteobacteria bacterium]
MKSTIRLVAVLVALVPSLQSCIPLLVGAGVGAGVMMAEDRRTSGTVLEDQTIEIKARNRISEKYGEQVNISATSFNRFVLLTGQAPTDEIKQDVSVLVLEVPNVRNVQNEIIVGGISSTTSRAGDVLLTSQVKGRLAQNKDVGATHVKVVSENGAVFLMGLVTRAEAESASQTAATTSGAQRVVKVFEYLD